MAFQPKTIKGKPIQAGMEHLVPERHTDAGVEEFNRGKEQSRVQIVSDPFEKALLQHEESPADQPWQHTDPVASLLQRHGEPGKKYRLLSERIVGARGLRGYVPVRDGEGNLVKLGTSVLGEMPEELAQKRDAFFQEESSRAVRVAQEEFQVKQEQMVHDAGVEGVGPLASNQVLHDVNDPSFVGQTGLQISRGNPI